MYFFSTVTSTLTCVVQPVKKLLFFLKLVPEGKCFFALSQTKGQPKHSFVRQRKSRTLTKKTDATPNTQFIHLKAIFSLLGQVIVDVVIFDRHDLHTLLQNPLCPENRELGSFGNDAKASTVHQLDQRTPSSSIRSIRDLANTEGYGGTHVVPLPSIVKKVQQLIGFFEHRPALFKM